MPDVMLNGSIYHETNSDEALAKIAYAQSLGGNLSTTIDGQPAWVFDGHAYIKGEAVSGYEPIDWNAVSGDYGGDSGSYGDFSSSDDCTHGA